MANVETHPQPHIPPHHNLMNLSSSLAFGFGLSSTPSVPGWPTSPPTLNPFANPAAPMRIPKRRIEHDDEDPEVSARQSRDDVMDRSPTPERPRRAAPKRARTTPAAGTPNKDDKHSMDQGLRDADDVDVGVLLASLPHESLLPLMTSLLKAQPSLKPLVLDLIPRPSLDTATQAITQASRRLLEAFPYSSHAAHPHAIGFGIGASSNSLSSPSFGFGRSSAFNTISYPPPAGGMREEYIKSRLAPHILEYVSVCLSYLPYFSTHASPNDSRRTQPEANMHSSSAQSQHKDKPHPSETFLFLHAIVSGVLSQPPITRASLVPMLLPRLRDEWISWIDRVDEIVNRQGGMFGQETVMTWARALDEFAQVKGCGLEVMREARDLWVYKVGWLASRQPMEEL